jgi:hypothetical protein
VKARRGRTGQHQPGRTDRRSCPKASGFPQDACSHDHLADVAEGEGDYVLVRQAENSDVSPFASVAVATITDETDTVTGSVTDQVAFPSAPVETAASSPRKVRPSPYPDASLDGLEKNSSVKFVAFTLELKVPRSRSSHHPKKPS